MSRETTSEAQERQQREREAAAFLSSLGPQFEKAGAGKRVVGGQRAPASNGAPQAPKTISSAVTVSLQESEDKRQQALRRLKATHCSVNQEKVSAGGPEREREGGREELNYQ